MAQYRRMRRVVIVFAPRPATTRWIDEELHGEPYKLIAVPSVAALVSRLSERADQIAIIDFDAVSSEETTALAAIRDTIWTGELIALGRVEFAVRKLLRVREMFMRPLGSERLRSCLSNISDPQALPIASAEKTAETMPHR